MALPQQKFREIVFQLLYSKDLGQPETDDIVTLIMGELAVTRKSVRSALEKVDLILEHQDEIDQSITKASTSYEFDRIQSVERNILRLGIYEMFYDETIPEKVAISEAIRLSKKFGSPEAASFVNAVLDALYKESIGEKPDENKVLESAQALSEIEEVSQEAIQSKLLEKEGENPEFSEDEDDEL
jgi:N utilization substance protein B